jgi:hypothetical protein
MRETPKQGGRLIEVRQCACQSSISRFGDDDL